MRRHVLITSDVTLFSAMNLGSVLLHITTMCIVVPKVEDQSYQCSQRDMVTLPHCDVESHRLRLQVISLDLDGTP